MITGARHDLLDVCILPVPSLDLVIRGLADVHTGIEPERLVDERGGLKRDAEALLLASFQCVR